jgi:hypothetical protein
LVKFGQRFGPFLERAVENRIGFSYIILTGNEADLDFADFARYLLDDPDSRVIAGFVEGFKEADKFLEVAKFAAERGKPIVLIKIGRSELGARAARSHTAALTGCRHPHRSGRGWRFAAAARTLSGAEAEAEVVLPWSTWAMIAMLRMSIRKTAGPAAGGQEDDGDQTRPASATRRDSAVSGRAPTWLMIFGSA